MCINIYNVFDTTRIKSCICDQISEPIVQQTIDRGVSQNLFNLHYCSRIERFCVVEYSWFGVWICDKKLNPNAKYSE